MSALSSEQRAFRDFEQAGWKTVAASYHDHFASLTRQAAPCLLHAVGAGPGVRLLDVCTGPGYVAGTAAELGVRAIGMDFSAPMIAHASRSFPAPQFVVGDAEDLPFHSETFDAVVTNFGLLHLGRPDVFLREAHRALRSGGRLAFTVWAPPEEAIGFGMVLHAIQEHGNPAVPLPTGPPFFRFSDAQESIRSLERAGFTSAEVGRAPQLWRLETPDRLFQAMTEGSVRTRGLLRAQTPEALQAIREALYRAVEERRDGDVYELPMPAVLTTAVKP
jgi:SAM-dependent methyltransferase